MAAAPKRITADELSYHRQVVAQIAQALAARDSWAGHLTAKYQLQPGDSVNDDGTIVRAGTEPPVSR
jgi:hypothetical protein